MVQLLSHLSRCLFDSFIIVFSFHEDVERFVSLRDDLLAMLKMVRRIIEALLVFIRIPRIWVWIVSSKVFRRRRSIENPRWTADEVLHICTGELGHLWHDLDAGRAIPNNSDPLV